MATKRPCRKGASVTLRPIGLLLDHHACAMNCVAAKRKVSGLWPETGQGAVEGLAIADFQTVAWLGIPLRESAGRETCDGRRRRIRRREAAC